MDPTRFGGPNSAPISASVDGAGVNCILSELQRYGGTGDGGTTRLAYSDQDLAAREYVAERMREAALSVQPVLRLDQAAF